MKLILNGGGKGDIVKDARQKLNSIIDHNKKALYIPLAWPDPTYNGCLEFMTNELSDVQKAGIEMIKSADELLNKNFKDYAFIYIGGGNTYKLLNDLKTSGAFEKIQRYLIEDDGIVYGGSAGAILFGKDLDSCNTDDSNDVGLEDNSGFDMLNGYSLLCHYTNREPKRLEESRKYLLNLSKQKPIYALPEEDTIFIDGSNMEIFGTKPYYEFKNGEEIKREVIKLVPYNDEDYEFVYNVKKNAYKKYVEECWGEWKEEDQRKHFERFINTVKNNTYIIMSGNKQIGFYNGEIIENGNYEVGNICVIPEYQGQGIGTKILKDKLEENKDRDIEIQYFKSNPVGKLYEKLGFLPIAETEFHYQMIKSKQNKLQK